MTLLRAGLNRAARGPLLVTVGGTVISARDTDIVAGGRTLSLTVRQDIWAADIGADNPTTTALIDGITAAQSEAAGWNAVVKAGLTFADVVRTSDTVVTITLPAFAGYAITSGEAITVTVPAAALADSADDVVAGPTFEVATTVVDWSWAGALSDTSFDVAAELVAAQTGVTLVVSERADLAVPVFTSSAVSTTALPGVSAETYHVARLAATGLAPDTTYYYGVAVDGVPDRDRIGRLRTAPKALIARSFRIAVGSCSNPDFGSPGIVFPAIEADDPLMFVHLGDMHYSDISTDDLPAARNGIRKHSRLTETRSLYGRVPLAYMYDDHDSGPNDHTQDTAGFATFMANSLTAYRDLVPHYPLQHPAATGWARGNAQLFTLGRVRFLLPDLHVQRNGSVSPPTILGDGRTTSGFASWDQKQWLLDQLEQAATDGAKLVVLLSSSSVLGTGGSYWQQLAPAEFTDILDHVAANTVPELLVISGDDHSTGAEDGGNMQTVFGRKALHLSSSPLRQTPASAGGPYEWLGDNTEGTAESSVTMTLDITDDGGPRITWTARFKDETGATLAAPKGGPFRNTDVTL